MRCAQNGLTSTTITLWDASSYIYSTQNYIKVKFMFNESNLSDCRAPIIQFLAMSDQNVFSMLPKLFLMKLKHHNITSMDQVDQDMEHEVTLHGVDVM